MMTQPGLDDLKITPQHLPTIIAGKLEELIIGQHIRVGDRLPSERELAATLGVSRNVIREATKLLQERGLVSVQSGSGVYVTASEADILSRSVRLYVRRQQVTIAQVYEARCMLEFQNVRLAAQRATAGDIAALADCLKRSRDNIHNSDLFTQLDVEFHRLLAAASQNPVMPLLLETIMDALHAQCRLTGQLPGAQENAYHYHCIIFEAIKARDSEAAYQAISDHLQDAWNWLLRVIENPEDEIGRLTFAE
jgi:GntR family transcriptional repressor for pyruvate dehydrogenase complex